MSLRLRLLLMIGVSLSLLWGGVAMWMLHDLEGEMRRTLDQRLAMSARMVAGLVSQNPAAWDTSTRGAGLTPLTVPATAKGLACQVSSLRGEVLARTPGTAPAAIATATPGFAEREIDGERWRTYTVEAQDVRITTADRLAERDSLLRDVMAAAVVPFVIALVGSLGMLWIGVRSGLVPLERLRQALARRAPATLTPIPDAPMPRELQPLVDTLNQLLERMRSAIARERRFTSDVAHELRTPLTALKTHLQVARITHGADAETALDFAEEGASRLQHTLQQLLTLAQVEGPFSWDESQRAYADEVARLAIRDAAPEAPDRIVFVGDGAPAALALPQALAVTALRNLLDNALRHSPSDQSITLEIEAGPDSVGFRVCDSGPGLLPDELARVTERFWRRDRGRGSGLGLAIVLAIAERCGGSLTLAPRTPGGLEAELRLPRAERDRAS